MLSRRAWIGLAAGGLTSAVISRRLPAIPATWAGLGEFGGRPVPITIYKSPTCGCCTKWVDHLEANGFVAKVHDVDDVEPYKAAHHVPLFLASCHTGVAGNYAFEGHIPADLIHRVLVERPAVAGLAVPGMPMGSPGMEGPRKEAYDVLAFTRDGKSAVFARR